MFTWSYPPGDQTRNNTVAIVSTVSIATTPEVQTSTTQPRTTKSNLHIKPDLNIKPNLNIEPNLNIKPNTILGKYNSITFKYEEQTKSTTVSRNRYTNYCSVYDLSQPIQASYQCVNTRIAGMSPAKVRRVFISWASLWVAFLETANLHTEIIIFKRDQTPSNVFRQYERETRNIKPS